MRQCTHFVRQYPRTNLSIGLSTTPVSLRRREADVALRLSSTPPDYLVGRKVGYVQFAVYASSDTIERVGRNSPLSAYPWIGWDRSKHQGWFDSWLAEHAPNADIVLRMDNDALMLAHAIAHGIGVQILPCFLGQKTPGLRRIAPLDDAFRLDLWLLTIEELRTNRRVRAFIAHAAKALIESRDELTGLDVAVA